VAPKDQVSPYYYLIVHLKIVLGFLAPSDYLSEISAKFSEVALTSSALPYNVQTLRF
jgi:hypothetical protein